MHPFVIVSNRLPVSVSKKDGKLIFNVSNGGLATAMSSLEVSNQIWVGWPGIASDELTAADKAEITKELKRYNCYAVHLSAQQIHDFYEGYSNDTLWPLFHYFPSYAQYRSAYWSSYREVNKKYATAVKKCAQDDATIWIQDYQLMLLPAMVRNMLPDTKIGYFHHIPFPSYEIFRLLAQRKDIIEGLLGADLVGFHIYDYARHFISSCNRILGTFSEKGILEYQGRRIKVDSFPIGIDYKKFRSTLSTKETKQEIDHLNQRYGNQKLIISVDRLDYSKGIPQRLEAFELFLAEHPELHRKVTMLAVAVPSRTEVETYQKLRDEVEQTISRINGQYSTLDWSPISYQFQNLQFEHIVALYAKADVALVTPLRDGMNLVAKEYVASKRNRGGVLILSEMTGAADELTEALFVNPNDIRHMARQIYRALTMSKKSQRERLKAMQARIADYDVQQWSTDFMTQLDIASASHRGALSKRLRSSDIVAIMDRYTNAKSRLILLDYDGTLHPYSTNLSTQAAKPNLRLRNQLGSIAQQPNTTLCIISGRPRKTLDAWFAAIPSIVLVAEHGAWIKQKGTWKATAQPFDKQKIVTALQGMKSRTAGAQIEEKDYAVVWHYRKVTPELAFVRNGDVERELDSLIDNEELGVYHGNQIIEVKPKSVEKSRVAVDMLQDHPADFIFCAGDDYTDEDMFASLPPDAHTVKVGFGATHARYQVGKLERVLGLIERMASKNDS